MARVLMLGLWILEVFFSFSVLFWGGMSILSNFWNWLDMDKSVFQFWEHDVLYALFQPVEGDTIKVLDFCKWLVE